MSITKKQAIYEIFFAILSLAAVIGAVADILNKIPPKYYDLYKIFDWSILIIFAIDYVYRFYQSTNKAEFFRHNIFDLLAILPFDSLFRALRIVRIVRILKLIRFTLYIKRFSSKADTFFKTNGFIYILWFTIISIFTGSILIYFAEKGRTIESLGDALWWSFVTTTTVGYGDISPVTGFGRILAAILMIIGIGFISMLTGTIATYFLGRYKKVEYDKNKNLDLSYLNDQQFKMVKEFSNYLKDKDL